MWSHAEPLAVLSPSALGAWLRDGLPLPERYLVAFSGGLDSTVLLHLMAAARPLLAAPLAVAHVDHGLQAEAPDWADHCRAVCAGLGLPLTVLRVDAAARPGESPEAAARAARYGALADVLGAGGMLLTAQHLDDQVETFFLQLLRGSGVRGLSAMPLARAWRGGWHVRPLLGLRRAALRRWALEQGLNWVEDPSNALDDADRNYLRRRVMPLLEARWPGTPAAVARSSRHCAEAAALVSDLAAADLARVGSADSPRLELRALCDMPSTRALNLLRYWLSRQGAAAMPARRMREALAQLCLARQDAAPCVRWAGWALRRYREQLWLLREEPGQRLQAFDWDGSPRRLGASLGELSRRLAPGGIDPRLWERGRVEVRARWPGLRCQPAGRAGHRSFKKLAQDCAIPPWLRDRVPVILIDGAPAAIAGCCVCAPFVAPPGVPGWHIDWSVTAQDPLRPRS